MSSPWGGDPDVEIAVAISEKGPQDPIDYQGFFFGGTAFTVTGHGGVNYVDNLRVTL